MIGRWLVAGVAASLGLAAGLTSGPILGPSGGVMAPGHRAAAAARQEANIPYDGRFAFARIMYNASGSDGRGFRRDLKWNHDAPRAEIHFTKLLSELSTVSAYQGGGVVLRLDEPDLMKYPWAYLCEPGFLTLSDAEARGMRNYLLKGGFLVFDDFGGEFEWYNFEQRIRQALPEARLVQLDPSHPVFDSFFRIESLDLWHPYRRSLHSEFWGVFEDNDPTKRLLLLANYNNDISEYWEWSDTDWAPIELSNEAYKLGINYVIYSMTH